MVNVETKKTVRVQADPIPESNQTHELANYFRSELRKRSNIENVDI